jgi:hypothetical protein
MKKIINTFISISRSAIKWWIIDCIVAVLTGGVIPPFHLIAAISTAVKWTLISKGLTIIQNGLNILQNILAIKEIVKEQEVIKISSDLNAA